MVYFNREAVSFQRRALSANLSPTKLRALVACLAADGTLHRCHGAWTPGPSGFSEERIPGMTVADLIRDGMLALTTHGRRSPAQLTALGREFAEAATARLNVSETVAAHSTAA